MHMFKNRSTSGRNNLCGVAVARLRKEAHLSQRMLTERLQLLGLDVDKNAVQRIESGQRFVTDIELSALARVFSVELSDLLKES